MQLRRAYKHFYPEEAPTFIPEVVDFFSVLRAYEDVARGLPGGFKYPALLTELKFAIVRLICERLRDVAIPTEGWPKLESMFAPGNVIITSNWDVFVESYACERGIRLRVGGSPSDEVLTLIKLHGSIDWTHPDARKPGTPDSDFAVVRELQNVPRKYSIAVRPEDVLRIRAVERMTLLRAGVARGPKSASVEVINPETAVHGRVRTYVLREAKSDFRSFSLYEP